MLVDPNYKKIGIDAKYAKYRPTDKLIVFDNVDQAQIFGEFVGAKSIFEVTDGFLVSIFGSFATTEAWGSRLLEAKKRYKLEYRIV